MPQIIKINLTIITIITIIVLIKEGHAKTKIIVIVITIGLEQEITAITIVEIIEIIEIIETDKTVLISIEEMNQEVETIKFNNILLNMTKDCHSTLHKIFSSLKIIINILAIKIL